MSKVNLELHKRSGKWCIIVVCSTILFTIIVAIYHQPLLALIVAGSLTCAMTVGTFVGSMIPLLIE